MTTELYTEQKKTGDERDYSYTRKVCMHVLNPYRMDARVIRAATALSDADFAVTVVDTVEQCSQTTEDINGIFVKHVKLTGAFTAARFKRWAVIKALPFVVRSIWLLLRTPADFYHAHDATALPACYIAARLRGKPLIFDAHELPLSELDHAHRRWARTLLTPFLSHMIARCAGGIGASPYYEQNLRERYHVSQTSLLRNVPPYRVVPNKDLLRQHLGLSSDTRIALYQGYLQNGRGLDRLVQAAAFLDPNIVIVMMGKGRGAGDASSQLKALIAREKVAERVKIIPHVPYEELLDWTVSADIGLITYEPDHSLNFQMCLPNKLFEFLMAGVPVLTSPLDAVIDVIKTHHVGKILPSLVPADIGAAINVMLADPVALANMHHNALGTAQHEFNWDKESPKLIRLYKEIQARTMIK
jgi:glycosyltransferase involved in cell wall biosynthesis